MTATTDGTTGTNDSTEATPPRNLTPEFRAWLDWAKKYIDDLVAKKDEAARYLGSSYAEKIDPKSELDRLQHNYHLADARLEAAVEMLQTANGYLTGYYVIEKK